MQENYESVLAIPYDMPIVGYGNHVVNTLRVWDAKAITDFKLDEFDRGNYHKAVEQENLAKLIVDVLYPNDNHYSGKELRLKQQYFFISASLQALLEKYKKKHSDVRKLHEKVIIQMNDTHPTVAVPELMRLLIDQEGLSWEPAARLSETLPLHLHILCSCRHLTIKSRLLLVMPGFCGYIHFAPTA